MILAYLALYALALGLMVVGCWIPAIALALVAHTVHHTPRLVRVRPIRNIHG